MDIVEIIKKQGYHANLDLGNDIFARDSKVVISFCHWNLNLEIALNKLLTRFLNHVNRLDAKDILYTVFKENIINSVKANMKRIYFDTMELNISAPEDYERGMGNFKDYMADNIESFEQALLSRRKVILISLSYDSANIHLTVENDTPLHIEEQERINKRLQLASEIEDMAEIFMSGMDETEGAGFGLLLMACLLKNQGLDLSNFSIQSQNGNTIAQLSIPFKMDKKKAFNPENAQKIVDHVDSLPTFPENVTNLQDLIESPDATISEIAEAIRKDIAITSNILKIANSALYFQLSKVETIERAIQLIGTKNLKEILYSIGTKRIMENKYSHFEEIWERSNECAFIARKIAEEKRCTHRQLSNIAVGSLLQDIGLVIIYSLDDKILKSVGKIVDSRQLPASISLEEAMVGISHTMVGSMITKKWNFPDIISVIIEYHHLPFLVDTDMRVYIYPIYLANMIIEYSHGNDCISRIEADVLEYFNYTRAMFPAIAKKLKQLYLSTNLKIKDQA